MARSTPRSRARRRAAGVARTPWRAGVATGAVLPVAASCTAATCASRCAANRRFCASNSPASGPFARRPDHGQHRTYRHHAFHRRQHQQHGALRRALVFVDHFIGNQFGDRLPGRHLVAHGYQPLADRRLFHLGIQRLEARSVVTFPIPPVVRHSPIPRQRAVPCRVSSINTGGSGQWVVSSEQWAVGGKQ